MTGCSGSSGPQMSDSEISAGQISTYQLKQQVSLYEKALEDPAIADSSQQRMELLKRLMDINDILQLDHRLMYYIDQLRDAAIENKDDAYRAMAEDLQPGETGVALATAHPAKLKQLMENIIEEPVILPEQLARFVSSDLHIKKMPNGFTAFKRLLLENA